MAGSVSQARRCICAIALAAVAACRQSSPSGVTKAPPRPQVSGTLTVEGLSAPVRVARDRWGVPHVYAETQNDLFFAQGFIQAQDRLFQMDLWRRSVQGRLSEVLGANFIERDVMTRRVQYEGDLTAEWASYGRDTRAIAEAFVQGINAWIAIARLQMPEEFVLAGWQPQLWTPEDLLNRTDAFLSSRSALDEVLRARLVTELGPRRADRLLPPGASGPTDVPTGLDPATVRYGVDAALRRVGTPAFFVGFAASAGSNAWVVAARRSQTGSPLLANDPHRRLDHPSPRYLIHLHGPGWNVIGATSPWLPGVALGHNDRMAWAATSLAADVQDLYVEKLNPAHGHQVEENGRFVDTRLTPDSIAVKGREKAFEFKRERTRHGPVIAVDSERNLAYTVRWTGVEPGTAAELAAPGLDRASSWDEFRAAAARWKTPAVLFFYADVDGNIGQQTAALIPVRRGWSGALPAPGSVSRFEWAGWRRFDDLPYFVNPPDGYAAGANDDTARNSRLQELFADQQTLTVDDFKRWQHDTVSWNAGQLVPLLSGLHADRPDVEDARRQLLAWDRRLSTGSRVATLYVFWERALLRNLAATRLEASLARDYAARPDSAATLLVPALTQPSPDWFSGDPLAARDLLLTESLAAALAEAEAEAKANTRSGAIAPWGALHTVLFKHPLGITEGARRRFNVGPFPASGGSGTLLATTSARTMEVESGASFRQILDLSDWDRSLATNAPGQSGSPGGPHFADLAGLWAAGEYFPLLFSDRAVQVNTESTLILSPRQK